MKYDVVVSGAWRGFAQDISKWAETEGVEMLAIRKNGLVICRTANQSNLKRLMNYLTGSKKSPASRGLVPFESAIFPATSVKGRPTVLRGSALAQEKEAQKKLPRMASTPRQMSRSASKA